MKDLLQTALILFAGVLFGGVSLWKIVAWYFHRFEKELGERASLPRYRTELEKRSRFEKTYQRRLGAGLDWTDRFFGEGLLGPTVFFRCWIIALVYPIVLFLLTWGLTGQHRVGEIALLPEGWGGLSRTSLVLAFGLYSFGVYWLFKNDEKAAQSIVRLLSRLGRLRLLSRLQARTQGLVLGSVLGLVVGIGLYLTSDNVTFSVAFAFLGAITFAITFFSARTVAFSGAFAFNFFGAVAFSGAVAFAFSVAFSFAFFFAMIGAMAFALTGAIIGVFSRSVVAVVAVVTFVVVAAVVVAIFIGDVNQGSLILVLFFGLLPLFNAFLDYLSWAISRRLGRSLRDRYHKYKAFAWWMLDFLIAAVLVAGLVFMLAFAVEGLNALRGEMVIDLDALLTQATADPWGEGFWITTMLLSTLLPTVLHFLFVMFSWIAMPLSPKKRAVWLEAIEKVEASPEPEAALSLYTRRKIAERLVWHRVGVFVLSVVACLLFVGVTAYLLGFFPQIGSLADGLAQVAGWGRGLVR